MKRADSLDAFRGYAILTMILSGTILTNVLPAWMSHAQVGPRSGFAFDPSIYGITWVDLVFPFFLFAMGAAFPFSIGRKLEKGESKGRIAFDSLLRGVRLTFFAIFIQHMYPWSVSTPQDILSWGVAITAFFLLFPMFMRFPKSISRWVRVAVELGAYAAGIGMMLLIPYAGGRVFSLGYSNIIILVLANMAIFGSLIYLFTYRNRWARVAVLPFVMAVFLGSATEGSWIAEVMNFTPLPWMYRFFYLKYLFIVIPGSVAGEYLREWLDGHKEQTGAPAWRIVLPVALLAVSVIAWNLYGLYTRRLVLNLWGTVALLVALHLLLRRNTPDFCYWRKLYVAGAYLLLLGLCFEAYEGGIRKDDSTYSYYFVTSGLAFMGLIAFSVLCDVRRVNRLVRLLELVGQNPMIAYVTPQLLIMPLLHLTGLAAWLDLLNQNAWAGFLRGVIVTTPALCVAAFCTKKKWFWRT
ncbi:DUF5009 domain-containing protein [Bacteroides zoogleoformans]|uniref:DUF5009 domain-containing protein n=1 Tax=Bacteroides zoogleoformans TaxID=28119 RepID=UPI00248DBD9D|nr:DUF5009 domain-containing protein [Bacteroides zoogleoformans]